MFRIAWGELFMLLNPLWVPISFFLLGVRRRRMWVRLAAEALGGTLRNKRLITGTTAGIPWELVFTFSLVPSRAFWHLTFPTLTSTDLVLRAEKSSDQKWKRRGFVSELTTGDKAFDERHLLLGSDPEAAARLLRHEPLRQAFNALTLEEGKDPKDFNAKGFIPWVQAGQGLEAELDLHRVDETEFPQRLAALFEQFHALGKTLQEAPRRGAPGLLRPRVLDVNAEVRVTTTLALLSMPVGMTALGVLQVLTRGMAPSPGLLLLWLLGLATGALLGLPWLWASRGQPAFHRRAWQVPCFAALCGMLVPLAFAGLNALPSSDAPVEERQVKVLVSAPEQLGGVEFWEVELEGLGTVSLPYDEGQAIPRDATVQVRLAAGLLGAPRVLSLTPVPAVATDSPP